MITRQPHPLDQVTLIGDTQHGLLGVGSGWRRVGAAFHPYSHADGGGYDSPYAYMQGDTHLLRSPAVAPLPLTPEQLEAEAESGCIWQDYTILAGAGLCAHGHILGAPVYVDTAGAPWLVQGAKDPGIVTHNTDFSAVLTLKRYGIIGAEPESGRDISVSLAAGALGLPSVLPGYLAATTVFILQLQSISSNGSEVIYALIPRFGQYVWTYTYGSPAAFWKLSLSGEGEGITAQLSVLRDLGQSIGIRFEDEAGTQDEIPVFEFAATHEAEGAADANGLIWSRLTLTGVTNSQTPRTRRVGVEGQLLAVLHDKDGLLVEISTDAIYNERMWLDGITWSIDRPHRCQFGPYQYNEAFNEEVARMSLSFRMGHETKYSVRLLRDGVLMDENLNTCTTLSDWQDADARTFGTLRQYFLPGAQPGQSWGAEWTGFASLTSSGQTNFSQAITGQPTAWAYQKVFGPDSAGGNTYDVMVAGKARFSADSRYGARPVRDLAGVSSKAPFNPPPNSAGATFFAGVRRQTNNLYRLVIDITPTGSGPNAWPLTPYVPTKLVAPRAVSVVPATTYTGGSPDLFASYHPLTQEIYAGYIGQEKWRVSLGVDADISAINWI